MVSNTGATWGRLRITDQSCHVKIIPLTKIKTEQTQEWIMKDSYLKLMNKTFDEASKLVNKSYKYSK